MKKNNGGFVLIAFITVFMASFTVIWLLHLNTLHRQQLEFDDKYQYQLHQARVQLFWLAREKPRSQNWLAWQTSSKVQQWLADLEQHGIAAQVEINPVALVVETGSQRQASQLSERMIHSTTQGTELKLTLSEEHTNDENDLWLNRQYRPNLPMATDLLSNRSSAFNVGSLEGGSAHLRYLQANQLNGRHLNATELKAQRIRQAPALYLNNVDAAQVNSNQVTVTNAAVLATEVGSATATSATIDRATVNTSTVATSSALNINANQVRVRQPLQLQGDARTRLNTIHGQLAGLEQSIYHCIEESLWCLAATRPNATIQSCVNCQVEQQTTQFEAVITMNVGVCIHGCGVRVSVPSGVAVTCPAQTIPARQQGILQCRVSSTVVNYDELTFNVTLDVYSGKNAAVFTRLTAPIRWQVSFLPCKPESHMVNVESSVPSMSYTLQLPAHPGGETYSWGGTVYQKCRVSSHQTFMRCDISASCSTGGNWYSIAGQCSCRGW